MPRAKAGAAKPAGKKAKGAYKLADPLPEGVILADLTKGQWRTGKPIGVGGFGMIYLACPAGSGDTTGAHAEYVVKVEPKSNGPLFSELSFYQRVAKEAEISQFKSQRKLKSLGMPRFVASGNHKRDGSDYRFMIMDRFSTDLQKLFEQNGKRFSDKTAYTLAIQTLDVLEFMHSKAYVHADIKASNMLLGFKKSQENQAFLVDFGLATKYTLDNKHKEYKEDPRRCHDGTIEFTSIDAHKGVGPSRRGDLEILGYCVVQWLCGRLPWEDNLDNKEYVRDQKVKSMKDVSGFMKKCNLGTYQEVEKYMKYVSKLGYEEQPDYNSCRKHFRDAIKKQGYKDDGKLDFSAPAKKSTSKTSNRKRKSDEPSTSQDSSQEEQPSSLKRVKKVTGQNKKPRQTKETSLKSPRSKMPSLADSIESPARMAKGSPRARVKSPMAKASPRVARVKSPVAKASPARRAKSPDCAVTGVSVNGTAEPKRRKKSTKPKTSVGVQTSPHLKGLRRSRTGR